MKMKIELFIDERIWIWILNVDLQISNSYSISIKWKREENYFVHKRCYAVKPNQMTCVYIEFHGREMWCSFYTKLILNLTWKYNVYALWSYNLVFIFPFLCFLQKILHKNKWPETIFKSFIIQKYLKDVFNSNWIIKLLHYFKEINIKLNYVINIK